MIYKVVKSVDKFNDKTTVTMNKEYKLSNGIMSHKATVSLRYVSSPGLDTILWDYDYEDCEHEYDFLYLDGRKMIIRINDRENISLPFIDKGNRETSSIEDHNGEKHIIRTECNFVKIDKTILGKICNAKSLEIKVNGQNSIEYSASKCSGLIDYCKIFYEGLYHEGLYNVDPHDIDPQAKDQNMKGWLLLIGGLILALIGIIVCCAVPYSGFGILSIILGVIIAIFSLVPFLV